MDAARQQCRAHQPCRQSAEQIQNQVTQITQLAEQIQNQMNIYQNMLQNTAKLPDHIWGQVEGDLQASRDREPGQGIAFSMGNVDDVLKQRFQSYADFKTNLPEREDFSVPIRAGPTPTATPSPAR